MRIIGLTGSIGMGKSTTAAMVRKLGVPVHDADATVHDLYAGAAAPEVERLFPGTVAEGVVDRSRLAARITGDSEALLRLEGLIHPMVLEREIGFLQRAKARGARLVLLDIPLLFEAGAAHRVDTIVVASAPAEVQRERVLSRPDMSEEKFAALLARQMSDADKRRRAHFVVDTSRGFAAAAARVAAIVRAMHYAV